mmetsp:Transcript_63510/g.151783  ORF Transcript_63510/g.151783 Transcript_63510/m.151783 type:complete len:145 (+) Transcript_63510:333-767(+)
MALSGIIVLSPEVSTEKLYLKAAIAASLSPSLRIFSSYLGHKAAILGLLASFLAGTEALTGIAVMGMAVIGLYGMADGTDSPGVRPGMFGAATEGRSGAPYKNCPVLGAPGMAWVLGTVDTLIGGRDPGVLTSGAGMGLGVDTF